ncbi:MAG: hypothetical protein ACTSW1_13175 [Candidatus Hodarchaeales archaeon]
MEGVDIIDFSFHPLVVDLIVDKILDFEIQEYEAELTKLVARFRKNMEWLKKDKELGMYDLELGIYDLKLLVKLMTDMIRIIEIFNLLEPLKKPNGDERRYLCSYPEGISETFSKKFSNLELNSKEKLGFEVLFHIPPEDSALNWYHNIFLPYTHSSIGLASIKAKHSVQTLTLQKRKRVKSFLKEKGLKKSRYIIFHQKLGVIKVTWRTYLEANEIYYLIDKIGYYSVLKKLNEEMFGWYSKYYGEFRYGYHRIQPYPLPYKQGLPSVVIHVDSPISSRDFLYNNGLSPLRYAVAHISIGMTLDTILVPGRAYSVMNIADFLRLQVVLNHLKKERTRQK